jgi:2-polyprenyl-3-methyl-5-hydroxy-6-metoxy-1,4-benzoquinol methylase
MKAGDCMKTKISYGRSEDAWRGYEQFILKYIDDHHVRKVCDVGGGANPLLSAEDIAKHAIEYHIVDISETELNKGSVDCIKVVADVASSDFCLDSRFDLVISKMLLEHIDDAEQFHKNVLGLLNDEGVAIHFFPTLYTLPFLVNHLAPEFLAEKLYNAVAARDKYQHAKFTAYYHWCRGPYKKQILRFVRLGYDVVEYQGFFGHSGYYRKINQLKKLHELKTDYLIDRPSPYLTSYAIVVLKKAASVLNG